MLRPPADPPAVPPPRVLDPPAGRPGIAVVAVELPAGVQVRPHRVPTTQVTLTVLHGRVELRRASGTEELVAGATAVVLPGDEPRAVRALEPAELLLELEPPGLEALAAALAPPLPDEDDLAALLTAAGVELLPRGWAPRPSPA